MSSNLADGRSRAECLELVAPSRDSEPVRSSARESSDSQEVYVHDTIPAPPPDDVDDSEVGPV